MTVPAGSYLLLQSSAVQTWIIGKITERLSYKINAKISIGKVDYSFFNQVVLNDVLFADFNNDTIFYTTGILAKIDKIGRASCRERV